MIFAEATQVAEGSADFISAIAKNPELAVSMAVTVFSVIAAVLNYLGKKKAAKMVGTVSQELATKKSRIIELGDLAETLIKGIEAAKAKVHPADGDNKNVHNIVADKADEIGTRELLDKTVKDVLEGKSIEPES